MVARLVCTTVMSYHSSTDSESTVLGLPTSGIKLLLAGWDCSLPVSNPVDFKLHSFRLGVAVAVNNRMWIDVTDGILGLAPDK